MAAATVRVVFIASGQHQTLTSLFIAIAGIARGSTALLLRRQILPDDIATQRRRRTSIGDITTAAPMAQVVLPPSPERASATPFGESRSTTLGE